MSGAWSNPAYRRARMKTKAMQAKQQKRRERQAKELERLAAMSPEQAAAWVRRQRLVDAEVDWHQDAKGDVY